jgi:two-component system, NtrC family, response regulator AtoC
VAIGGHTPMFATLVLYLVHEPITFLITTLARSIVLIPLTEGSGELLHTSLFMHDARMRGLLHRIERVAETTASVLIRGESGVGKDVVARTLHALSPRRDQAFVKVNCAALPGELLESELFGYERGAFTGAYKRKPGKFDLANGGTIFLDEIGDLPLSLQAKLLHVLQDGQFARVGGSHIIDVDARVIASTNRDLERAIRAEQFRQDLYYRLKVVSLHVPPLRERRSEIPVLAQKFVQRFNEECGRSLTLSADSIELLTQYSWPGNVRELENLMKSIVVLGDERLIADELAAAKPPPEVPSQRSHAAERPAAPEHHNGVTRHGDAPSLREISRRAAREAEARAIKDVLDRVHWNRAEAARLMKISYKAFLYRMDQCGLSRKGRPPEQQRRA